jgi:phosphatidylserine decarboxylase
MAHYPHPIIAREGWLHIAIAFVCRFGVQRSYVGWLWAIPFWVIALFRSAIFP